jgi:uncharacterized protein (DUF2126 family)
VIGDASRATLPEDHWQALAAAGSILIDEFSDDVSRLLSGGDFDDTWMANYLPPQFERKYTALFAKKMVVCVAVVAWKLEEPGNWPLACVGEQLALRAIIERADVELDLQGKDYKFESFWDLAFSDTDFPMLYEPAWDGVEDTAIAERLGAGNLAPDDWVLAEQDDEWAVGDRRYFSQESMDRIYAPEEGGEAHQELVAAIA